MQDHFDKFDNQIRESSKDIPPLDSNFNAQVWAEIHSQQKHKTEWQFSRLLEGTFLSSFSPLKLMATSASIAVMASAILGIWIGSNSNYSRSNPSLFSIDRSSASLNLLDR